MLKRVIVITKKIGVQKSQNQDIAKPNRHDPSKVGKSSDINVNELKRARSKNLNKNNDGCFSYYKYSISTSP